jgi:hypothetical protein
MRIIIFLLLLGSNFCIAAEWDSDVNSKLDGLVSQLNDGCSDELSKVGWASIFCPPGNTIICGQMNLAHPTRKFKILCCYSKIRT